jgi:transmembrane sensor
MKPELLEQLKAIEPRWDATRAAAVRGGLARRSAVRARRRAAGGALAAAACVGLLAVLWPRSGDVDAVGTAPGAAWHEVLATASMRVFTVDQGGVWFTVTRRPDRVVRVLAGGVEVEVVGTRFLVERAEDQVRVQVDHGRVRVRAGGEARELTDGAEASFPLLQGPAPLPGSLPAPGSGEAPPPDEGGAGPSPSSARPLPERGPSRRAPAPRAPASRRPDQAWQRLAAAGDYARAWDALREAAPPSDEPVELLLAADVARLSRHPEAALGPLERLLALYPFDARAPLAAFTLGRVLLDELGRPREAAAAFARVREVDPTNALAEDALAREVESHDRAGDAARAHTLALEYERRYPEGQRLRAVRHFGGLQ